MNSCFNYSSCTFHYRPCTNLHPGIRFNDSSASWVLTISILVFFMKAGFMLLEIALARSPEERRYVVVLKFQDAFASAFGFFLIGFDFICQYHSSQGISKKFFGITDPMFFFYQFTVASNAATILGGCLVNNKYKMRLPAAFVSAFVISGIIHPLVARIIWSGQHSSLSPFRFCANQNPDYNCASDMTLTDRIYVLDFAGGGAVHLIGGMAGLIVCLFAKFQDWKDRRKQRKQNPQGVEAQEEPEYEGFWDWMYPAHGGEGTVTEAALGVFILWFCWIAFNCGSIEDIEFGHLHNNTVVYPHFGLPSVIAVNMIMSGATGGITAIVIATWAQILYRAGSVNANKIANGVLSALVAISAGCPFVDYWGACLIGWSAVIFYHCGCYLEYKFNINDTARIVPVHGVCGLWSLIATGLFLHGNNAEYNLHAVFEGFCYCELRLPNLNYGERLLAQIIGALMMIGIGGVLSFLTYFILHIIPIKPFIWCLNKIPWFLSPADKFGHRHFLYFRGGWLLTSPDEGVAGGQGLVRLEPFNVHIDSNSDSHHSGTQRRVGAHSHNYDGQRYLVDPVISNRTNYTGADSVHTALTYSSNCGTVETTNTAYTPICTNSASRRRDKSHTYEPLSDDDSDQPL